MNNNKKSGNIFFSELIERFPELKDDLLDEDFQGIISLQMGVFTRFTQGAINKGNYDKLKKCYEFINNNIGNVSSELENSMVISYLGKLKFGESSKAKQLLPVVLRKIIDDLDSYNNSVSKSDKLNQFLKNL